MGAAIGQVLPYAVAVALTPPAIVGVVLMLSTPRGRVNGSAFLLGWVIGLVLVGTIALLVSSGASASSDGKPATWLSVAKLIGGLLLVLVAYRQWEKRSRGGGQRELPGWLKSVDRFDWRRSGGLGLGLSAVNPKNLLLALGAAGAIAQTGIGAGDQAIAYAIFVLIATVGPALPVGIYYAMGERGAHLLDQLRTRMARESPGIMAVICLLLAAKLIGDAITGFAS
jgi:threonine/homoserine/homoserine lactone efflux protein